MKGTVKASVLSAIDQSFQAKFNQSLNSAPGFHKQVCMFCPSSAGENIYGWLASLPQIGKVAGEYIRRRLQLLGYRLVNDTWGGIIEVPRESIEDDTYGMFGPTAAMWGERAAQTPDIELVQLLINGFSSTKGKDYTGSAFFGTTKKAHSKAKVTINNTMDKKLSATNFQTAYGYLRETRDAEGVPLYGATDPSKVFLVVCSDDEATADSIVKLETLSGGGANPNYNKAKVIVLPGLQSEAQSTSVLNDADARPWFLLDCGKAVGPLIYQERLKPELTPNFALTSDRVFNEDLFAWKARFRMAMGYGLPELAYGSTGKDAA
jgi:phage major head subunit gpT-like protein